MFKEIGNPPIVSNRHNQPGLPSRASGSKRCHCFWLQPIRRSGSERSERPGRPGDMGTSATKIRWIYGWNGYESPGQRWHPWGYYMDVMEYFTGYFMNILWIFMEQIMEYNIVVHTGGTGDGLNDMFCLNFSGKSGADGIRKLTVVMYWRLFNMHRNDGWRRLRWGLFFYSPGAANHLEFPAGCFTIIMHTKDCRTISKYYGEWK